MHSMLSNNFLKFLRKGEVMKKVTGIIMAMAIMASIAGCDSKKEDNSNKVVLLLLMDQMSGNCVTAMKYDAAGTQYAAMGTKVPKAACSNPATYTIDASAAKAAGDAGFDKVLAIYSSTNCSSAKLGAQSAKDGQTTASLTTAANTNPFGCTPVIGLPTFPTAKMYFCKDQASIDAQRAMYTTSTAQ